MYSFNCSKFRFGSYHFRLDPLFNNIASKYHLCYKAFGWWFLVCGKHNDFVSLSDTTFGWC